MSFLRLLSRFFGFLLLFYRSYIRLYGAFFKDYKRIVAYSTSSQLCLIRLFFVLGSFIWGIFYVYIHAFFKASLFILAGIVIHLNESQLLKFFSNTVFWGLFLFCLLSIIRIPFLSVATVKDDLLLNSSGLVTSFLLFFALSTIFYSLKLSFVYRFNFLGLSFRGGLFFGLFLVFFGVFFDLNSSPARFFDDFSSVYTLIFMGFSLSFFGYIIFCYDIFWKFFGLYRFYLGEIELRVFWGFFVFLFFVL